MAATTQRSVKRTIEKRIAAKSGTRGSNTPKITQDMVRKDLNSLLDFEGKTSGVKALLRRHALQLTASDVSLAIEWSKQWDATKVETKGNEAAINAKNAAAEYFRLWFDIPAVTDAKTQEGKLALRKKQRAMDIVEMCVAVHRFDYGDGFDFADDGSTFLTRGTTIAEAMWAHMGYDKIDSLKGEERAKRFASVLIHARKDQVAPGDVSWDGIQDMLSKKLGKKRQGGAATQKVADTTKAVEAMTMLANAAKGNAAQYTSNTQKLRTLDDAIAVLTVAFPRGPLFNAGWESVDKGVALWRDVLKAVPVPGPAKSLADAKGADVLQMFNRKGDVATPETAKTLPHPNGPAAKTARKTK